MEKTFDEELEEDMAVGYVCDYEGESVSLAKS